MTAHLLDSLGSCSSSGGTHFGVIFCPSLTASNKTRLDAVYVTYRLSDAVREVSLMTDLCRLVFHDMTPSAGHLTNFRGVVTNLSGDGVVRAREEPLRRVSGKTRTEMLCGTFVLNSRSQTSPCLSFLAVQVSPSSRTILPNSIPRAYMLGMVMTYSV